MSKPVIYVIDDHEAGRDGLEALLSVHGYQVESFGRANDFLSLKSRSASGCVITDLRMDGVDGLDLLIELENEHNMLPVILVSAYATVPEAVQIMKHGAITLIQKPYEEKEILDAVGLALEMNQKMIHRQGELELLNTQFESLSEEEAQILEFMISGESNKKIALNLGTSIRTIDRRRHSIFEKMNVYTVAELTMLYAQWRQYERKGTGSVW